MDQRNREEHRKGKKEEAHERINPCEKKKKRRESEGIGQRRLEKVEMGEGRKRSCGDPKFDGER